MNVFGIARSGLEASMVCMTASASNIANAQSTGAVPGAHYNYDPAPPEVMERVARLEAVCKAHDTRLIDAAFRFPLLHPTHVSVIPGGKTPEQTEGNLRAAAAEIPQALWEDLKAQGLMRQDAPVAPR